MGKSKSTKSNFLELRSRAEKKLKSEKNKSKKAAALGMEHELNVYKIELEMQNEELLSANSKLLFSVNEYAELFDYAPVSYFILNKEGVITTVNYKGAIQFGVDKNKLIGRPLSVFISKKASQDNYYRYRNLIIENGKSHPMECEFKRPDGSLFFALMETTLVKDEKNNFKHFLTIISDITEQKDLEYKLEHSLVKEKELNEMKSKFVTIASHEFRTPLSAILTSAELIEKYKGGEKNEKTEKHFRRIKTSVSRLREILMDFLSADEIESKKAQNKPETFNLVMFVEDLIEEIKIFNGIHAVNYNYNRQTQNVHLDKKLLKTCLTNLIINAYKYSPNGGAIEIITEQKKPHIVSIMIKDHGIGIPEKDQHQIFNSFFRAANAENIQGTGLGLNITKKLVTIMGGNISFISKENEGTTFFLKFPKE